MHYLYAIIGPTDKIYFGITKNPKERWWAHRKCKRNHPLYNSMRKYGRNEFSFHILSEHETEDAAKLAEIEAIANIGTQDRGVGYNISPGGDYDSVTGAAALREKLGSDRQFRDAFSLNSKRRVTATWAARSDSEKQEIFGKISDTLKKRCETDAEFYNEQRGRMLAAREKGDVRQRAAAASAGIKRWWGELRADPERYNDYIQRRKETLQETNRRKRA